MIYDRKSPVVPPLPQQHAAVMEDEAIVHAPVHLPEQEGPPAPHSASPADMFRAFQHLAEEHHFDLGPGPSITHTNPTTPGGPTTTQTAGAGDGQVTYSTTTTPAKGSGDPTTTQSVGVGAGGGSYTTGTTTTSRGTTRDTSTTYTAGGSGVGVSRSQTTTTGDDTTTRTGGVSVDPGTGAVTVNGGGTTNGTGASGSLTVGPDGVSGSGSVQAGPVKVGATFGFSHTDVASTIVQGDQTSQVSDVLGGKDYVAATRSDEQKLGGNLAVKAVSLSADTTSNSTMQVFQQLPAGWAGMDPQARADWYSNVAQQQQNQLGSVTGLADVQVDQIPEGTGIRCKTSNGWNAGAGVNYGAVSMSLGGGQTSSNEVTLAKTNGMLEVSLVRTDGLDQSIGAGLAGFGVTTNNTNTNAHQVKFQVDPSNAQGMAAMKQFMATGLLPGADGFTDKDGAAAAQKFSAAKSEVDQLNAQIQPLQAQMAQTGAPPGAQLAGLYAQLDAAQQALSTNRNYLNDRWQAQYGTKIGATPVAGVSVDEVTDTNTQTAGGTYNTPIGDIGGGTETRTWVHRQYQGTGGTAQHQFNFDDQYMGSEQHVGTDTDPNHVVLSMFSDTSVNDQNASTIKNLRNSGMPAYVADAIANHQVGDLDTHGQVNVSLNAQQLNMITASLNDMNNPASQKMWADFATRSAQFMAGQDFSLKTGDAMKDQASSMGADMGRRDWYFDLQARDPNDPLNRGLASFGSTLDMAATEQAAAAKFATIKSPADFQKLTPDQQKLFISVIEQTSGPVHDLTGQRNSYEALAACALLHDDAAPQTDAATRAQSMAELFREANDQGKHENTDAVLEFVKFTGRFQEDPARYAQIQQGMSFDWKQGSIDNAVATQTAQQIGQSMADGFHSKDNLMAGFDFGGGGKRNMVDMMEAANKQGGAQEVQQIVQTSGISPQDLLARVADDPVRQHMMHDLLTEAGYKLDGIQLAYCP